MAGVGGNVVLDEKSYAGCALASWGGRIHVAWTGSDYRVNLLSSPDGRAFDGKQTLPSRTYKLVREETSRSQFDKSHMSSSTTKAVALSPALAASPDAMHVAWTGTDSRLNVWDLGRGRGGPVTLPERTTGRRGRG